MNRNKPLLVVVLQAFLVFSLFILSSCSGCSPSARKRHLDNLRRESKSLSRDAVPRRIKSERTRRTTPISTLSLPELYDKYKSSVFMVFTSEVQGSGFFVSKGGLAVSNYHVIEDAKLDDIFVKTIEGHTLRVEKIVRKSKAFDYVVFKIRLDDYKVRAPIPVASTDPLQGEEVFTIGNPAGYESTLSCGIVSGFRSIDDRKGPEGKRQQIQTTTEITHGSSGGPLMNMQGEVVGITSSGCGEANLNFAVNISNLNLGRELQ